MVKLQKCPTLPQTNLLKLSTTVKDAKVSSVNILFQAQTLVEKGIYVNNRPYSDNFNNSDNLTKQLQIVKNNDGVYEFFPDCYPGDGGSNVLKISVAVDYGVFLALGTNQLVIDEIENLVSVVRLVYTRQTHIRIDIDRLHIGKKNSLNPLGRNKLDGSCVAH